MRVAKAEQTLNSAPTDGVALVITDRDEKLLVLWHRKHRFWTVPLGKVELGETGIHAAYREALEELGIKLTKIELLDTIYKPFGTDDYSDITITLCRGHSYEGEIKNCEPDKHDQIKFLSSIEIVELESISFPTKVLLEKLYDYSRIDLVDN